MALPKTFTGGERLFAEDLNDNFEALDTAIGVVQADVDSNEANLNASNLNTGTVDYPRLPAGSIVRVIEAETSSGLELDSTTAFVNVPGLSITFSPRSADNKVFVIASLGFDSDAGSGNDKNCQMRIVRNTTGIRDWYAGANSDDGRMWHVSTNSVLDSPNTTESVTYKLQARTTSTSNSREVNINWAGGQSVLTAFEVSG